MVLRLSTSRLPGRAMTSLPNVAVCWELARSAIRGTLDPAATGVLVLGVGKATRLLRFLTELPKSYVGEIVLGVETSTLDADGEISATHDMSAVTDDQVRTAALSFVGPIMQIPPMVSAVKVDGKRLYELAREGKEIERRPRSVAVYSYELEPVAGESGVWRLRS